MKTIVFTALLLPVFLITSAQLKDPGNGISNLNQAVPSPGILQAAAMGSSELIVCDEAAKTFSDPFDKSRFKNMSAFTTSGTFTVPAGVTEVLIEMWGAGGGGHFPGGGGGSGGYWTGLVPVTGISTITLTVGTGGAAGTHTLAGGNGGNTSFSCTGFNITAAGGLGADSLFSATFEQYRGGRGGTGLVLPAVKPAGFNSFFAISGQSGTGSAIDFIQVNASLFSRRLSGGAGGIAPFSGQAPNVVTSSLLLTGSGIRSINSSINNFAAGSFGSGGSCLASGATAGGTGRVAVYF
jgi:hypothetical protein